MTSIRLNGQDHPLAAGATIAALVSALTGRKIDGGGKAADGGRLGVAVALNADIVPRSRWSATALQPGDDVEIVTAVQGG
jgi:sulfur carrier protein